MFAAIELVDEALDVEQVLREPRGLVDGDVPKRGEGAESRDDRVELARPVEGIAPPWAVEAGGTKWSRRAPDLVDAASRIASVNAP